MLLIFFYKIDLNCGWVLWFFSISQLSVKGVVFVVSNQYTVIKVLLICQHNVSISFLKVLSHEMVNNSSGELQILF